MNLTALLAECYRRAGYPSTPSTAETVRLTAFLNATHRQLLATPGMDRLRDDTITFASGTGVGLYGLPPSIVRIEAITDRTTMRKLNPASLDDIRSLDPGLQMTGPPDCYINRGWQQVQSQPAAATGLWVASNSASDTTQSVKIETIRSGGFVAPPTAVTLNGTTRVQITTTTDNIEVVKFYLSAVAVGEVTLYTAAAAGSVLALIPPGGLYARFLGIQLYPTPTSAITYYVDYVRNVADMVNLTDEPLLPEDFHWLLVEGAMLKEWTKRDDDRRIAAAQDYANGLSSLKYFMHTSADDLPTSSRARIARSRFGAYFPATRY